MSRDATHQDIANFINAGIHPALKNYSDFFHAIRQLVEQVSAIGCDRATATRLLHDCAHRLEDTIAGVSPDLHTPIANHTIELITAWPATCDKMKLGNRLSIESQNKADFCASLLLCVFHFTLSDAKLSDLDQTWCQQMRMLSDQYLHHCQQYHQTRLTPPPVPKRSDLADNKSQAASTAAFRAHLTKSQPKQPPTKPTKAYTARLQAAPSKPGTHDLSLSITRARKLLEAIDKYFGDNQASTAKKEADREARLACFTELKRLFDANTDTQKITAFLDTKIYDFSAYRVAYYVGISTQEFSDVLRPIRTALNDAKGPLTANDFKHALKTDKSSATIAASMGQ